MKELLLSYLKYLETHPEAVHSILLWNITMVFVYWNLIKLRPQMVEGAKSDNRLFESNEQIIYILNWVWPGSVSYLVFFNVTPNGWTVSLLAGMIAYTIGGRWLFQWALAFKNGISKVEDK